MTAEQLQGNLEKTYGLQRGQAAGANWANATCGKPMDKKLSAKKKIAGWGCADYYQLLVFMEAAEKAAGQRRSISNATVRNAGGVISPYYCPQNRGCPGAGCKPWLLYK